MITREELKAHCEEQIAKCEAFYAEEEETLKNHRLYQEHKLVLELLEQESKTGHWIVEESEFNINVKCSCCNYMVNYFWSDWNKANYCPNCRAKMESEADNESKTEEQVTETTG